MRQNRNSYYSGGGNSASGISSSGSASTGGRRGGTGTGHSFGLHHQRNQSESFADKRSNERSNDRSNERFDNRTSFNNDKTGDPDMTRASFNNGGNIPPSRRPQSLQIHGQMPPPRQPAQQQPSQIVYSSSMPQSQSWMSMLPVEIITDLDEKFEGILYACDMQTDTIAIMSVPQDTEALKKKSAAAVASASPIPQQPPATKSATARSFHIFKLNALKSLKPIKNLQPSEYDQTILKHVGTAPIDLTEIANREQAAKKTVAAANSRRGVGVTVEAQDLFDYLSRTLPCRWAHQIIIVLDVVRIDPPYLPSNCAAETKDLVTLNRVKRLIEERKASIAKRKGG